MANAAHPSPLPKDPRPSCVVAFTEINSGEVESAFPIRWRINVTNFAIFGFSSSTVESMLLISNPRLRIFIPTSLRSFKLGRQIQVGAQKIDQTMNIISQTKSNLFSALLSHNRITLLAFTVFQSS